MTCQARTSYTEDEILWGYRFEPCMSLEKGAFHVDYSRFEMTFEVQTPAASARQLRELRELRELEQQEHPTLSLYWDHLVQPCGPPGTAPGREPLAAPGDTPGGRDERGAAAGAAAVAGPRDGTPGCALAAGGLVPTVP